MTLFCEDHERRLPIQAISLLLMTVAAFVSILIWSVHVSRNPEKPSILTQPDEDKAAVKGSPPLIEGNVGSGREATSPYVLIVPPVLSLQLDCSNPAEAVQKALTLLQPLPNGNYTLSVTVKSNHQREK